MPVWRPRRDWLHEALASALVEKACEIELIVIDDGNDVPVSETISDLDDPRIRLMRIPHSGPYAARNAGLKVAQGNFVRFFDADDIVAPGSTGRLLASVQAKGKEAIAVGWTMMCDEHLRPQRLLSGGVNGHVAEQFLLGLFDVYAHGMLCPKTVLDRVGPWDESRFRLMGDRDYVQRVLEQAPLCVIEEVVTFYRRHSPSITGSSHPADAVKAGLQVLKGYFDRHPEKRGTDLERAAYNNLHFYRSRQFLRRGEIGAALWQLARAAQHDPASVTSLLIGLIHKNIARFRR